MSQGEPSVDVSFQAECSLSTVVPAYQVALNSGDTEKVKTLQCFLEDHFEGLCLFHRDTLLQLSLPALSAVLSSDRLNIYAESTVWLVIEDWINVNRAERLEHLPLLFKSCLRIGRFRLLFIRHILRSSLYLGMSAEAHEQVKQHVAQVCGLLGGAPSQEAIIDGHGLLYHKGIVHFRPRDSRHLLVAAGGQTDEGNESMEVYEAQLNMWRPIELELPVHTGPFQAIHFLDGVIYLVGGFGQSGLLHALDLTQAVPSWSKKAPMLKPRDHHASVILDGALYALGGSPSLQSCERYLPTLDRWEAMADLHYGRSWPSAVTFRGRIFIAGGVARDFADFTVLPSVEVYTPGTDTWLQVSSMPSPRYHFTLLPYGNRLWALGGYTTEDKCESYDPQTDSWRQEGDCTVNRYGACACFPSTDNSHLPADVVS